jgi:L-asparaginase / beta-aspartyl-peptidase
VGNVIPKGPEGADRPGAVTLVGSQNAEVGIRAGWEILRSGGHALDAVEAVTRLVEDNPLDHTVGYSGYPNLLGEVELDASIMDGVSRRAGAVGALRGYRHAITVARAVMERTPHVLVVGDGASRLAADIGLENEDLLTDEMRKLWRDGIEGKLDPDGFDGSMLAQVAQLVTDPERVAGTVNVLAVDAHGAIASAVSTSGWAWKHPGRCGDSPLIGAGNYADVRYGAAACTGWGELAIRAGTARSVVAALAAGLPIEDACSAAVHDQASLVPPDQDLTVHVLALAPDGSHCAASTKSGTRYVVQLQGMAEPELRPRLVVEVGAGREP